MAKEKVTELVREILDGFLKGEGYELYDTEFLKEGKDWFLRVYVDKACDGEHMSTDDCEKISRYLSKKLDETDPIEQNYYLEVSSPGMDRQLTRPEHYAKYIGNNVDVKLYKARDGMKNICGELRAIDGDVVTVVDDDDNEWKLNLTEIAKTKLTVEF